MTVELLKHVTGCTPIEPCVVCEVVQFLKQKLRQPDFDQFVEILGSKKDTLTQSMSIDTLVENLPLESRIRNALTFGGCKTLEDVLRMSESQLRQLRNFGTGSINRLHSFLSLHGMKIGELDGK